MPKNFNFNIGVDLDLVKFKQDLISLQSLVNKQVSNSAKELLEYIEAEKITESTVKKKSVNNFSRVETNLNSKVYDKIAVKFDSMIKDMEKESKDAFRKMALGYKQSFSSIFGVQNTTDVKHNMPTQGVKSGRLYTPLTVFNKSIEKWTNDWSDAIKKADTKAQAAIVSTFSGIADPSSKKEIMAALERMQKRSILDGNGDRTSGFRQALKKTTAYKNIGDLYENPISVPITNKHKTVASDSSTYNPNKEDSFAKSRKKLDKDSAKANLAIIKGKGKNNILAHKTSKSQQNPNKTLKNTVVFDYETLGDIRDETQIRPVQFAAHIRDDVGKLEKYFKIIQIEEQRVDDLKKAIAKAENDELLTDQEKREIETLTGYKSVGNGTKKTISVTAPKFTKGNVNYKELVSAARQGLDILTNAGNGTYSNGIAFDKFQDDSKRIFANKRAIGHNIGGFDIPTARNQGIDIQGDYFDTLEYIKSIFKIGDKFSGKDGKTRRLTSYDLGELARVVGIDLNAVSKETNTNQHVGDFDVEVTDKILKDLMSQKKSPTPDKIKTIKVGDKLTTKKGMSRPNKDSFKTKADGTIQTDNYGAVLLNKKESYTFKGKVNDDVAGKYAMFENLGTGEVSYVYYKDDRELDQIIKTRFQQSPESKEETEAINVSKYFSIKSDRDDRKKRMSDDNKQIISSVEESLTNQGVNLDYVSNSLMKKIGGKLGLIGKKATSENMVAKNIKTKLTPASMKKELKAYVTGNEKENDWSTQQVEEMILTIDEAFSGLNDGDEELSKKFYHMTEMIFDNISDANKDNFGKSKSVLSNITIPKDISDAVDKVVKNAIKSNKEAYVKKNDVVSQFYENSNINPANKNKTNLQKSLSGEHIIDRLVKMGTDPAVVKKMYDKLGINSKNANGKEEFGEGTSGHILQQIIETADKQGLGTALLENADGNGFSIGLYDLENVSAVQDEKGNIDWKSKNIAKMDFGIEDNGVLNIGNQKIANFLVPQVVGDNNNETTIMQTAQETALNGLLAGIKSDKSNSITSKIKSGDTVKAEGSMKYFVNNALHKGGPSGESKSVVKEIKDQIFIQGDVSLKQKLLRENMLHLRTFIDKVLNRAKEMGAIKEITSSHIEDLMLYINSVAKGQEKEWSELSENTWIKEAGIDERVKELTQLAKIDLAGTKEESFSQRQMMSTLSADSLVPLAKYGSSASRAINQGGNFIPEARNIKDKKVLKKKYGLSENVFNTQLGLNFGYDSKSSDDMLYNVGLTNDIELKEQAEKWLNKISSSELIEEAKFKGYNTTTEDLLLSDDKLREKLKKIILRLLPAVSSDGTVVKHSLLETLNTGKRKAQSGDKLVGSLGDRTTSKVWSDKMFEGVAEELGLKGAHFFKQETKGIKTKDNPAYLQGRIGTIISEAMKDKIEKGKKIKGKTIEQVFAAMKDTIFAKVFSLKDGYLINGDEVLSAEEEAQLLNLGSQSYQNLINNLGLDPSFQKKKMITSGFNLIKEDVYTTNVGGGLDKDINKSSRNKTSKRYMNDIRRAIGSAKTNNPNDKNITAYEKQIEESMFPKKKEYIENIQDVINSSMASTVNNNSNLLDSEQVVKIKIGNIGGNLADNEININELLNSSEEFNGMSEEDFMQTMWGKIQDQRKKLGKSKKIDPSKIKVVLDLSDGGGVGKRLSIKNTDPKSGKVFDPKYIEMPIWDLDADNGKYNLPSIASPMRHMLKTISKVNTGETNTEEVKDSLNSFMADSLNYANSKESPLYDETYKKKLSHAGVFELNAINHKEQMDDAKTFENTTIMSKEDFINQWITKDADKNSTKEEKAEVEKIRKNTIENLQLSFEELGIEEAEIKKITGRTLKEKELNLAKALADLVDINNKDSKSIIGTAYRNPLNTGQGARHVQIKTTNDPTLSNGKSVWDIGLLAATNSDADGDKGYIAFQNAQLKDDGTPKSRDEKFSALKGARKVEKNDRKVVNLLSEKYGNKYKEEYGKDGSQIQTKWATLEKQEPLISLVEEFAAKNNKKFIGIFANYSEQLRNVFQKIGLDETAKIDPKNLEQQIKLGQATVMREFFNVLEQDALSSKKVGDRLRAATNKDGSLNKGKVGKILKELEDLSTYMLDFNNYAGDNIGDQVKYFHTIVDKAKDIGIIDEMSDKVQFSRAIASIQSLPKGKEVLEQMGLSNYAINKDNKEKSGVLPTDVIKNSMKVITTENKGQVNTMGYKGFPGLVRDKVYAEMNAGVTPEKAIKEVTQKNYVRTGNKKESEKETTKDSSEDTANEKETSSSKKEDSKEEPYKDKGAFKSPHFDKNHKYEDNEGTYLNTSSTAVTKVIAPFNGPKEVDVNEAVGVLNNFKQTNEKDIEKNGGLVTAKMLGMTEDAFAAFKGTKEKPGKYATTMGGTVQHEHAEVSRELSKIVGSEVNSVAQFHSDFNDGKYAKYDQGKIQELLDKYINTEKEFYDNLTKLGVGEEEKEEIFRSIVEKTKRENSLIEKAIGKVIGKDNPIKSLSEYTLGTKIGDDTVGVTMDNMYRVGNVIHNVDTKNKDILYGDEGIQTSIQDQAIREAMNIVKGWMAKGGKVENGKLIGGKVENGLNDLAPFSANGKDFTDRNIEMIDMLSQADKVESYIMQHKSNGESILVRNKNLMTKNELDDTYMKAKAGNVMPEDIRKGLPSRFYADSGNFPISNLDLLEEEQQANIELKKQADEKIDALDKEIERKKRLLEITKELKSTDPNTIGNLNRIQKDPSKKTEILKELEDRKQALLAEEKSLKKSRDTRYSRNSISSLEKMKENTIVDSIGYGEKLEDNTIAIGLEEAKRISKEKNIDVEKELVRLVNERIAQELKLLKLEAKITNQQGAYSKDEINTFKKQKEDIYEQMDVVTESLDPKLQPLYQSALKNRRNQDYRTSIDLIPTREAQNQTDILDKGTKNNQKSLLSQFNKGLGISLKYDKEIAELQNSLNQAKTIEEQNIIQKQLDRRLETLEKIKNANYNIFKKMDSDQQDIAIEKDDEYKEKKSNVIADVNYKGTLANTKAQQRFQEKQSVVDIKDFKDNFMGKQKAQLGIAEVNKFMPDRLSSKEQREGQKLIETYEKMNAFHSQRLADYDQEKGILNGIQLSEEKRVSLNKWISLQTEKQNVGLDKIQAKQLKNNSFFGQVIGGFKSSLRNLTDYSMAYAIIGQIRQGFQQTIQITQQLDKALVNLQIVTGKTRAETTDLMLTYNKLGEKMGATTEEVSIASNDFLRMGYEGAEAAKLTEHAMRLSKLGMIDSASATTFLTSAIKGYGVELDKVGGIVDMATALDMKYAVSSGYILEAMARTAAGAKLAGMEMSRLQSIISIVGETTQRSPESIGEALKTSMARFTNVKVGKLVDAENPEEVEGINDIEKALGTIGIQIRKNGTDWRNYQDVLDDVGGKFNTLNDLEKNTIITAMFGTRQREIGIVALTNYNKILEANTIANNSAGTAAKKYQAVEESLETATKRVTVAWEELVLKLKGEGAIRFVVDQTAKLIKNLGLVAGLAATITAAFALMQIKNGAGLGALSKFYNFTSGVNLRSTTSSSSNPDKKLRDYKIQQAKKRFKDDDSYYKSDSLADIKDAKQEYADKKKSKKDDKADKTKKPSLANAQYDYIVIEKFNQSLEQTIIKLAKFGTTLSTDEKIAAKSIQNRITNMNSDDRNSFIKGNQVFRVLNKNNDLSNDEKALIQKMMNPKNKKYNPLLDEFKGTAMEANTLGVGDETGTRGMKAAGLGLLQMVLGGLSFFGGSSLGAIIGKQVTPENEQAGEDAGSIIGGTIGGMIPMLDGVFSKIPMLGTAISAGIGIIGGVWKAIDDSRKAAIKKQQDEYQAKEDEYKNAQGSIAKVARYDELVKGVDSSGNNIALTNEEYKEFLEINKELLGIFPDLETSYDAQGNSIIKTEGKVGSLTSSINEMIKTMGKASQDEFFKISDRGFGKQQGSLFTDDLEKYKKDRIEKKSSLSSLEKGINVLSNTKVGQEAEIILNSKEDNKTLLKYLQDNKIKHNTFQGSNDNFLISFKKDEKVLSLLQAEHKKTYDEMEKDKKDFNQKFSIKFLQDDWDFSKLDENKKKLGFEMAGLIDPDNFTGKTPEEQQKKYKDYLNNIMDSLGDLDVDATSKIKAFFELDKSKLTSEEFKKIRDEMIQELLTVLGADGFDANDNLILKNFGYQVTLTSEVVTDANGKTTGYKPQMEDDGKGGKQVKKTPTEANSGNTSTDTVLDKVLVNTLSNDQKSTVRNTPLELHDKLIKSLPNGYKEAQMSFEEYMNKINSLKVNKTDILSVFSGSEETLTTLENFKSQLDEIGVSGEKLAKIGGFKSIEELFDKLKGMSPTDAKSYLQSISSQIIKATTDSTKLNTEIGDLTSILKDLEENGLKATNIKKILTDYPDLIAYLGNETALREKIKDKIEETKVAFSESLAKEIVDSVKFRTKIYEDNFNLFAKDLPIIFDITTGRFQIEQEKMAAIAKTNALIAQGAWTDALSAALMGSTYKVGSGVEYASIAGKGEVSIQTGLSTSNVDSWVIDDIVNKFSSGSTDFSTLDGATQSALYQVYGEDGAHKVVSDAAGVYNTQKPIIENRDILKNKLKESEDEIKNKTRTMGFDDGGKSGGKSGGSSNPKDTTRDFLDKLKKKEALIDKETEDRLAFENDKPSEYYPKMKTNLVEQQGELQNIHSNLEKRAVTKDWTELDKARELLDVEKEQADIKTRIANLDDEGFQNDLSLEQSLYAAMNENDETTLDARLKSLETQKTITMQLMNASDTTQELYENTKKYQDVLQQIADVKFKDLNNKFENQLITTKEYLDEIKKIDNPNKEQEKENIKSGLATGLERSLQYISDRQFDGKWANGDSEEKAIERIKSLYDQELANGNIEQKEYNEKVLTIDDSVYQKQAEVISANESNLKEKDYSGKLNINEEKRLNILKQIAALDDNSINKAQDELKLRAELKGVEEERKSIIGEIQSQFQRIQDEKVYKLEQEAKAFDWRIKKEESLIQLTQKRFDTINQLSDAQNQLDKDLSASKLTTQWLDDTEREKIFNEKDYENLSDVISEIQANTDALSTQFYTDINNLTEDNMYLEEFITSEYERRLAIEMQKLEVSKQELDLTKKQQQLNNVLAEKSVKMFTGGEYKYVANAEDLRKASDDLIDAENTLEDTKKKQAQQQLIDEAKQHSDGLKKQQASIDNQITMTNKYTEKMNRAFDGFLNPIMNINTLVSQLETIGVPGLIRAVKKLTDGLDGDNNDSNNEGFSKVTNLPNGQTVKVNYDKDGKMISVDPATTTSKSSNSGSFSSSVKSSSSSSSSGIGKTVTVDSSGKAPAGLSVGTTVKTAGGNYSITGIKSDGSYSSVKIPGKAVGTESFEGGFVNLDELGKELIRRPSSGRLDYLEYGSQVVPAQQSKNLLKWSNLNPDTLKPPSSTSNITNMGNSQTVKVEKIELNNVTNGNNFMPELNAFLKRKIPVTAQSY